jgi:hypothetical protein
LHAVGRFGQTAAAEGFKVVGWRDVPVDLTVVGKFSKATQPIIKQAIVQSEKGLEENDLERGLYLVPPPNQRLASCLSLTQRAYSGLHCLVHLQLRGWVRASGSGATGVGLVGVATREAADE